MKAVGWHSSILRITVWVNYVFHKCGRGDMLSALQPRIIAFSAATTPMCQLSTHTVALFLKIRLAPGLQCAFKPVVNCNIIVVTGYLKEYISPTPHDVQLYQATVAQLTKTASLQARTHPSTRYPTRVARWPLTLLAQGMSQSIPNQHRMPLLQLQSPRQHP